MQSGATTWVAARAVCMPQPRLVVPENSESRIRLQEKFLFGGSLIPTSIKRSNQPNTIHDIHHRAGSLSSIKFCHTVIVCVPVKPELLVHQESPSFSRAQGRMLVSNEKMNYELKTSSYYPDPVFLLLRACSGGSRFQTEPSF